MGIDAFIYWANADLIALHAAAKTAQASGVNRFIVSTSSGDVSVTKEAGMPWGEFMAAINYALSRNMPSTYAPKISRTNLRFS